jgi:hypothetical protein
MADTFENVSMIDDLNKRSGWAIGYGAPTQISRRSPTPKRLPAARGGQ